MTDNIKAIFYKNIALLEQTDKAICYFREQQNDIALGIIADSIGLIRNSIESIIVNREYFQLVSTDSVMEMLSAILESYKKGDYILLADLLELQLISFIIGVQELIMSREEIAFEEDDYQENLNMLKNNCIDSDMLLSDSIDPQELLKEGYRVEFSSCGLMTLAARNEDADFYFHTNGRIYSEAFMLARHWYKTNVNKYVIYGLGFGYHIYELISLSKRSEIIIHEGDMNVILLACAFTRLKDIFDSGRVKLVYDPEFNKLEDRIKSLKKNEAFYVHYPSFQNIRNKKGSLLLKKYVSFHIS